MSLIAGFFILVSRLMFIRPVVITRLSNNFSQSKGQINLWVDWVSGIFKLKVFWWFDGGSILREMVWYYGLGRFTKPPWLKSNPLCPSYGHKLGKLCGFYYTSAILCHKYTHLNLFSKYISDIDQLNITRKPVWSFFFGFEI